MSSYTYEKLAKKMKKLGFRFYKMGKGSHRLWVRDEDKKVVPVPFHQGRDIRTGTLRAIVRQLGVKDIQELDQL